MDPRGVYRSVAAFLAELERAAASGSHAITHATAAAIGVLDTRGSAALVSPMDSLRHAALGWCHRALRGRREPILLLPLGRRWGTALERDALLCLYQQLLLLQPNFESGRTVVHAVRDLRDEVELRLGAPAPGPEGRSIVLLMDDPDSALGWSVEALLAAPRRSGLRVIEARRITGAAEDAIAVPLPEAQEVGALGPDRLELALALAPGAVPQALLGRVLGIEEGALSEQIRALADRIEAGHGGFCVLAEDRRVDVERQCSSEERAALLHGYAQEGLRGIEQPGRWSLGEDGYWTDFLTAHLQLAAEPLAAHLGLVTPQWERISRSARPDPLWFAWDVERVRARAEHELITRGDVRAAASMVRCALVEASLRGLRAAPLSGLHDGSSRARALVTFASFVEGADRDGLVRLAVEAAREPPASGEVMIEVALSLAGAERTAMVREAIARLPIDPSERVRIQLAAAPVLGEDEAEPLLDVAFAELAIDQLDEINRLVASFPQSLAGLAATVAARSHRDVRRSVLALLVPRMAEETRLTAAEEVVRLGRTALHFGGEADAGVYEDLRRVVPWLPVPALEQLLADEVIMDSVGAKRVLPLAAERLAALGGHHEALAKHLPRPRKRRPAETVEAALSAARAAQGSGRMIALAQVASRLPAPLAASVAAEAVEAARLAPPEDAWAWFLLVDLGALLAQDQAGFVLGRALDQLVRGPRSEMLWSRDGHDMRRLAPLLLRLGGAALVVEAGEEMSAIAAWYP